MTLHPAKKLVIITEKLIATGVCAIIDECGATGYTIIAAGGKGKHSTHATSERATVIGDFSNVKIEVILYDKNVAQQIIERVAETYFKNFPGITYLENVEILRPFKFQLDADQSKS